MKKKLIQYVSVLLSFLAGLFLTSYLTQVGNRDMTTSMAINSGNLSVFCNDADFYHIVKSFGFCKCDTDPD